MSKQIREVMLQLGIEPMSKTGLHDQCSNHSAIQAQFHAYFSYFNDIESLKVKGSKTLLLYIKLHILLFIRLN